MISSGVVSNHLLSCRILELSLYADGRVVFGVPLEISTQYASVQLSTSGPDDSLYVWG